MNKPTEIFRNFWRRTGLALAFAAVVFLILLLAIFLVLAVMLLLWRVGVLADIGPYRFTFLVIFGLSSLIVGTVIAAAFSRLPLKPVRKVVEAMDRIADGDYSTRLELQGPKEFRSLSREFNYMAEELDSVEMLRDDFVNNFSHEFKTPIVSISGFAKILKNEDLMPEEREEYLDIIMQESQRLADLSTNVLNLSRIEKQTILTDKEDLNVSEEIRLAVALMDSKWPDKKIDFRLEGEEVFLHGNEELMRQVWINMLDNAIKFSPDGGRVTVATTYEGDKVKVSIANEGQPIPPEKAAHIFDKFYQGDLSHTTKGNGLGLTIAKEIAGLHGGSVSLASSDEQGTVFEVLLPKG